MTLSNHHTKHQSRPMKKRSGVNNCNISPKTGLYSGCAVLHPRNRM